MKKISEGEITSMVRRFFRINGFRFLSTSSSGEKLYYTFDGNTLNNKQPDSIVTKGDIVIICEDKILFSNLFSEQNQSGSDFTKLTRFLNSEVDLDLFRSKLPNHEFDKKVNIVGCLSSLIGKPSGDTLFISESLLNIQITTIGVDKFSVEIQAKDNLIELFDFKVLELSI